MKSKRITLKKFLGKLDITAKGTGCVLAQVGFSNHLINSQILQWHIFTGYSSLPFI